MTGSYWRSWFRYSLRSLRWVFRSMAIRVLWRARAQAGNQEVTLSVHVGGSLDTLCAWFAGHY